MLLLLSHHGLLFVCLCYPLVSSAWQMVDTQKQLTGEYLPAKTSIFSSLNIYIYMVGTCTWFMCRCQRIIYGSVSFQYVGPRDQSQVVSLDSSHLSLLLRPMHSRSSASLLSISHWIDRATFIHI